MILPDDPKRPEVRSNRFAELLERCAASREERRARARSLRQWYLTGTDGGSPIPARYNKIKSAVDGSTSYLFAPEVVRFGLTLGPHYGEQWVEELDTAREELHRLWHDNGFGLAFGLGVRWAHVWATSVWKALVSRNSEVGFELIPDPADVGVLREDLDNWDDQEALCHWYTLDLASFARLVAGHPRGEALVEQARRHEMPLEDQGATIPQTPLQIVLSTTPAHMDSAGYSGVASTVPAQISANPRVREPVIQMAELWVWDDTLQDGAGDYRVVTMLDATKNTLVELRNPLRIPGAHPFLSLTLDEVPGYLWGTAIVEDILQLQIFRESLLGDINDFIGKSLDPPLAFFGVTGSADERAKKLRERGATFFGAIGGDVRPLPPQGSLEFAFALLEQIDRMFADQFGVPQVLQGQGEPGLRAGNQAGVLATLGSSRVRLRAMLVESALERAATLLWRIHARTSAHELVTPSGRKFLPSQLPDDVVARVSAHSGSPLYAEQIGQKALVLHERKVIDDETLVDLMDPPMADLLRVKARRLQKGKAETQERVIALQEERARHGRGK